MLQADILYGLSPDGKGVTVVGDDAQSIYSFRAATVRNIFDLPKHYPDTTVITLEQNYRSTEPILEATNGVIALATERYTKNLWSERSQGERPWLVTCEDEDDQTEFVVGKILEHRESGIDLHRQAVLFRASHHSMMLEAELARRNIPFHKYGGLKFVETAHVKDLMALPAFGRESSRRGLGRPAAAAVARHRSWQGPAIDRPISRSRRRFRCVARLETAEGK